jgi:hypothetical protein
MPGFGPCGTSGHHCFDPYHPAYVRIAHLTALRRRYPVLPYGRQYQRPISFLGHPFDDDYDPDEVIAWSRILNDEEVLCVLNSYGTQFRGADIVLDADLNPQERSLQVILNTAHTAHSSMIYSFYSVGTKIPINRVRNGTAYVSIRDLLPSEVLVLTNYP